MLALLGGEPAITFKFNPYVTIGNEEELACLRVLRSGSLSAFYGSDCKEFYGGREVLALESEWADYFQVEHAISVNSNTSGLICALGAIGLEPGDEVIVSPWTMCASATSILVWNALPVFADIEPETFNLDPISIENKITKKTKAIVVPDIFGHSANLLEIMAIAKKYNLFVIEDAAQAPGALYMGRAVGTVGDIGVYSLNYHKHIHSGEGGVCVTNHPDLAEKIRLIRNHAEAVVSERKLKNITNMVGFNFRLTELQAAIAREQLRKLSRLLKKKQDEAQYLISGLNGLPGLRLPVIKKDCTHAFYLFPMILGGSYVKKREFLVKALRAEGLPFISEGYANIHLLEIFQRKIAYGSNGFPWNVYDIDHHIDYQRGTCPVAEDLHANSFFSMEHCLFDYDQRALDGIVSVFKKVWQYFDEG